MRWEDERYVRIFTRDTPTWDAFGWEAQALLMLIFRKMDRTGLLELGVSGMRGLAACVRMPIDVVERSLAILIEDGVLAWSGPNLFAKNFMAAQECAKSDSLRSREKRERAHLQLTQSVSPATQSVSQTPRSDTSAPRSDTPSVPFRTVPSDPSVPKHSSSSPMGPEDAVSVSVRKVFEHYKAKFPKRFPRVHSGLKEWALVRDRIAKDGRTVGDLCKCIDGYCSDPWHQGKNDRGKEYLGLELFVRDEKHVADGISLAESPRREGPKPGQAIY